MSEQQETTTQAAPRLSAGAESPTSSPSEIAPAAPPQPEAVSTPTPGPPGAAPRWTPPSGVAPAEAAGPLPAGEPFQALRISVTVMKTFSVIGMMREDCDPVFETVNSSNLEETLAAVPAVRGRAEAHWAAQPKAPPKKVLQPAPRPPAAPPAKTPPRHVGGTAKPEPPGAAPGATQAPQAPMSTGKQGSML